MRLLSTRDHSFHEFHHNIPQYAILSHTWGDEEISYHDWLFLLESTGAAGFETLIDNQGAMEKVHRLQQKAGYRKIIECCQIALLHHFEYVWIDTCCIDKGSSAELSEAINSMFQWYKQSGVCYAYLSDVLIQPGTEAVIDQGNGMFDIHPDVKEDLAESRWFSRGWTLQELIGPREVHFYAENWAHIGSKTVTFTALGDAPNLNEELSDITGILSTYLRSDNLHHASVAQKMSWASRRETTRVEDMAYCLLGIFGVNMPLLYGEGEQAFLRLQVRTLDLADKNPTTPYAHPLTLLPGRDNQDL